MKPETKEEPTTVVGSTIIIRGRIKSDEDLVIEGRIDAEITSTKALVVENSGIVKASVQVRSARISGVVVGDITAEAKVEIAPDGRVVGNILSPKIVIRDGAAFRGRIDMPDFDAPRAAVPQQAATTDVVSRPPAPPAEPVEQVASFESVPVVEPVPAPPPVEAPWEPVIEAAPDSAVMFGDGSSDNVIVSEPPVEDPFAPPAPPPPKPAMAADRDRDRMYGKRNKRF